MRLGIGLKLGCDNIREPYGYALQNLVKFIDSDPINEGLLMVKIFDTTLFSPFKGGLEDGDSYIIMYLNMIYLVTNLTCKHRAGKKDTQVELNEWQRTGHNNATTMITSNNCLY